MATTNVKTETSLQLKRIFAAPREKVFRAWTQPEELRQWFAPTEEYSVRDAEVDLKVGGKYRIAMKHRDEKISHVVVGTFREVRPLEKLVYTWHWEEAGPEAPEMLVTVEFHDRGGSTEIVLTHEFFPDDKARDEHNKGWTGCLDRLAKFLSS